MDLWPEDINEPLSLESPYKIVSSQAHLLGEKTNNIVIAEIIEEKSYSHQGNFSFIFFLKSGIQEYRYRLFDFSYPMEFYPVYLRLDADIHEEYKGQLSKYERTSNYFLLKNKDDLADVLSMIFHSEKTKKIISALYQIGN